MKKSLILVIGLFVVFLVTFLAGQEYFFKITAANSHIAVPGIAFHTASKHDTWDAIVYGHRMYYDPYPAYVSTKDSGEQVSYAPVYFPDDGQEVKSVKVRLKDDEINGCVWVGLYKKDYMTDELIPVAGGHTSITYTNSSIETLELDIDKAEAKIDNSRYAWFLEGGFYQDEHQFDLEIHQVIIAYNKKNKNK